MNKKYLAIIELAKQKEVWKDRIEALKFGCWFGEKYYNDTIVKRVDSHYNKLYYEGRIKKGRLVIYGQFSITDLVEWLGGRYCISSYLGYGLYELFDTTGGHVDLNKFLLLNPGDLQDQPDEVLEKVYNLMKEEVGLING